MNARTSADTRVAGAVAWLVDSHRARAIFGPMPAEVAPADLAQAYAIQDGFVAEKARLVGPPAGWKIALASRAMQRFVGLAEPIGGRLHRHQVVAAPSRVRSVDYVRLLVEFEIAVELGAALPPRAAPYSRAEAADAVAAVRPAFELADDRGADYGELAAHGLVLAADNAWNEGTVLGAARADWRRLDLAALRGQASIDGESAGAGHGRDLMGDPLEALAWLANHAAGRGPGLAAGDIAILGSLVTSKFPRAGQRLRFELDGFEPIELAVV